MSGGSFNYLAFKEPYEMFTQLDELRSMEEWLRDQNKHDAADELFRYRLELETARRRLGIMHQRLYDVMYAAEWWRSGDYGEDGLDKAWAKFTGAPESTRSHPATRDLLDDIRALRNHLAAERDATPHADARARLDTAIAALNALLPEQWRVY